jgi:membrane protein
VFSFAPVIFIVFSMIGLFTDQIAASSQFYEKVNSAFGQKVMVLVQDSINALPKPSSEQSLIISIISFGALLFAASGIFFQVQFALNRIWQVPPPVRNGTMVYIRQQLFSFLIVIGFGLLGIFAILLNFLKAWIGSTLDRLLGVGGELSFATWVAPLLLLILTFILFYKLLPETKVAWGDVWLGAVIAAVLILAAITLVGFFINHTAFDSALQATGAFIVLLSVFFYIAEIFLVGAVICRVYSGMLGSRRSTLDVK